MLVPPCELTENGGCDQKCENDGEEAVCSCGEGFKLNKNNKKCDKS